MKTNYFKNNKRVKRKRPILTIQVDEIKALQQAMIEIEANRTHKQKLQRLGSWFAEKRPNRIVCKLLWIESAIMNFSLD